MESIYTIKKGGNVAITLVSFESHLSQKEKHFLVLQIVKNVFVCIT